MDSRTVRTRARLQCAVLSLLGERDLEMISVADIADRAEVNRSTYYQHYVDKDTLLADALDTQTVREGVAVPRTERSDQSDDGPRVLLSYVEHVAAHADLYRRAFSEGGSPTAIARLRARFDAVVADEAERRAHRTRENVPVEIIAAGMSGSLIALLVAWLQMEPRPPVERAAHWGWLILMTRTHCRVPGLAEARN